MGFFSRKVEVDIHARAEERARLFERALGKKPRVAAGGDQRKSVAAQLIERKMLEPAQATAAAFEARARGVGVPQVLGEQGTVPAEMIIEVVESTSAGLLAGSLEFDVRLPHSLLLDYRIVVHAQTDKRLIISTTSSFNVVRQLLTPYAEGREIVEVPFSFVKWGEFRQGISKIMEPGDSLFGLEDPLNPVSVIPMGKDDSEILDLLVDRATLFNASDIHIEPGKHSYNVFFRALGTCRIVHSGPFEQYARVLAMVKDRARLDPMETRVPQDGAFPLKVRGRPFDLRVATIPTDGAEKIIMRLLDPVRGQMRLKQLGITEVDEWLDICRYRNGIVLIVGSTGSGKTTTLNATVRELERFEKKIYTAEDPVEYRIPYVSHVQMNEAVGLDYARAIRAFMRGDPDIIILGEIRDNMTANKAIQAAETGHLVIATIHAESVPMAIQRLKGLGVRLEDFEMLLRGILVQFLVRTVCQSCGGSGCNDCVGSGYNGRTVVSEIARVYSPLDIHKILKSETDPESKYWRPLWKDLESKLVSGVTNGQEIYRAFESELSTMALFSEPLDEVYREERAKRGLVSAAVGVAQVGSLNSQEKMVQRKLAQQRLSEGSGKSRSKRPASREKTLLPDFSNKAEPEAVVEAAGEGEAQ